MGGVYISNANELSFNSLEVEYASKCHNLRILPCIMQHRAAKTASEIVDITSSRFYGEPCS